MIIHVITKTSHDHLSQVITIKIVLEYIPAACRLASYSNSKYISIYIYHRLYEYKDPRHEGPRLGTLYLTVLYP